MENNEPKLEVSANATICFLEGCPQADTCIHRMAYLQLGDSRYYGNAVHPSSLKEGQCVMYQEAKLHRMARASQHLFDEVRMKHYEEIRSRVMQILQGRTSFYRCLRGEKLIDEETQQRIEQLFRQYGYPTDSLFDSYVLQY